MSFRYSEYCERYEYINYDLQTPIETPANNQFQKKTDYNFTVDSTGEQHPFDWYNNNNNNNIAYPACSACKNACTVCLMQRCKLF